VSNFRHCRTGWPTYSSLTIKKLLPTLKLSAVPCYDLQYEQYSTTVFVVDLRAQFSRGLRPPRLSVDRQEHDDDDNRDVQ